MAKVFNDILKDATRRGIALDKSRDSIEWLRSRSRMVSKERVNERKFLQDKSRLTSVILPGHMYMFKYDAKTKDTLPYWDAFPLIFPYRKIPGGFMGLNLHYLPYQFRARLMDALYPLTNNDRYDESTKLRLSYDVLNGAAKYRYFKPCIKQYLSSHVRSRFVYVHPTEWDMALMLPTEQFQNATKQAVWQDSRGMF